MTTLPPATQRLSPAYQAGTPAFAEPWVLAGVNWNLLAIQVLIDASDNMKELLKYPPQRIVRFSVGFDVANAALTHYHLYALLIQSRGGVLHQTPCKQCRGDKKVFEECYSRPGYANEACAGCIWRGRGENCAFNCRHGGAVGPTVGWRSRGLTLANQNIVAQTARNAGISHVNFAFSQSGAMMDTQVNHIINNAPVHINEVVYQGEAGIPGGPGPIGLGGRGGLFTAAGTAAQHLLLLPAPTAPEGSKENPIELD